MEGERDQPLSLRATLAINRKERRPAGPEIRRPKSEGRKDREEP